VLHSGQYGYRLDNGTLMALLNVANEIGRAIHKKKRKHHILGHQKSLWLDSKEPLETDMGKI
jgi:hypothetical protein